MPSWRIGFLLVRIEGSEIIEEERRSVNEKGRLSSILEGK